MPAFLDRRTELARLSDLWQQAQAGVPQLVVVYGRRRIGKTSLLWQFKRDKPSVFHVATRQGERTELHRLSDAIRNEPSLGQQALDQAGGFGRWEDALRFLVRQAEDRPLLVVIDELPYLLDGAPGFGTAVQAVWEEVHLLGRAKLMLVLTGSARRVIEGLFSGSGPLYGRTDERMLLEPFDIGAAHATLPELEPAALLEAYAACGGYPLHLLSWNQSLDTASNLARLAGTPGGVLLEDGEQIMFEEVAARPGYERILAAVARGANKYSSLRSEVGQRIEQPIDLLRRVGLLQAEVPVGAPQSARPVYRIGDPYLAFWFGVLYEGRGLTEATGTGAGTRIAGHPRWRTHVAAVFEEAARAHARLLVDAGVLEPMEIGRWWTARGEQAEIDVVGWAEGRARLIGEARWSALDDRDLARLVASVRQKAERLTSGSEAPRLAIWARQLPVDTPYDILCFSVDDLVHAMADQPSDTKGE